MLRNYFKIAIRNLWKNKMSSAINIIGLTVGLTCCLLMVLFIQHELSYDKFQKNGDRIVRLIMEYRFSEGELTKGNFTSTKVFPAFKRAFPEVEEGVRMTDASRLVKYEENLFNEKNFMYADSTFFILFPSFRLLVGQPDQVMKNMNSVVLTRSTALKYFKNLNNAVGKTILVGSKQDPFLVTGIVEDCPTNSQISFDFLATFSSLGEIQENTYWNANYTTYLLLKNEASIASLQKKIEPFMKKEMAEERGAYVNFILEPFTRIHLYSPFDAFEPNTNITYIYIVGAIALLILAIACFTYINLSTARSIDRAKEVGIRKVAGAFRKQVFWQFIGESLLLTLASLVLSILLAALLLPGFNALAERNLQVANLYRPFVLWILLFFVVSISLLAGSYPALILSKFQPIRVLKGAFKSTGSGTWLRTSLIVFQFMVSVFLIIATFIIRQQLNYIQHKKLGYDREHVLVIGIDQKIVDKIELVKTEFKSNPNVIAVSRANNTPVKIAGGYSVFTPDKGPSRAMNIKANPVDEEYIKANSLQIVAGSDLTRQDNLDADREDYTKNYFHYILNESAVNAFGWKPEEAIGKKIFLGEQRPGEVKAVIKDFHFASLHTPVEPLILFPGGWGYNLIVKTNGKNLSETLSFLEKKWKALAPHRPFEYRFMDEDFNKLYRAEMRTGKVFTIFSIIAILLACLGLFGLSSFAVQQRIKEIGIRKVLGASAINISVLLSSYFMNLVAVAFVLSAPLAWWAMNEWLQDFAYRISISGWLFALAGVMIVAIALLTVSLQVLRAVTVNPVKSLRSE